MCTGKEITHLAIAGFDDLFSYIVVCSQTNVSKHFYASASPVLLSVSAYQPHSSIPIAICNPQHR